MLKNNLHSEVFYQISIFDVTIKIYFMASLPYINKVSNYSSCHCCNFISDLAKFTVT